ncbi:disease resistance protein RGA2 isoform X2 [Quercus suber]|uniref:disease resistance protein RGA2 isoform X2 n=1 Tax=Quercus suber TaxID=58331 RepID=UPI0032DF5692
MTELAFSVAEKVIEKLGSLAYSEISLTRKTASDLKKLKLTMSTIQAVLLDAEEKQMKNRGLSVWLEQLKDVFHDAMDVLDEFECEDLRKQVMKTHGSTSRKLINSATRCSKEGLNLVHLRDLHFSCVLNNFNNSVA